jgi:hypothetical protein
MLLLLGDGTRVPVAELPGDGPWTFLVLQPEDRGAARVLGSPATDPAAAAALDELDLPALVVDADPASAAGTAALERLPGRLGGGPGWAGIAPDAPPR